MKTKFLFFTLGLFIFTSCFDSEDTPSPATDPSNCKLLSFGVGDEYFPITYDDNGRISSIAEYEKEDDSYDGTYTIQRDANGRVTSMTQIERDGSVDEIQTFEYNESNSTITMLEEDLDTKIILTFEGSIENFKLLEAKSISSNGDEYTTKFTWLNGNIVKEESRSGEYTYEYYDSENSLISAMQGIFILVPDVQMYSKNNVKKVTSNTGHTMTYTYTYHEDGRVDTQTVQETRNDTDPTYIGSYTYTYTGCE